MSTKRALHCRPRPSAEDLLLDGFFGAWSRADTPLLASAIYRGHVTGVALALELNWSRDKVSRRTDELRSAGLVAKRRENGWVRTTLVTEGVEAAQRWAQPLRQAFLAGLPAPAWKIEARMAAAGALAHRAHRRLLHQLVTTPGATQAELVASCDLSQPTASRTLRDLEAGGLVEVRREGGRDRHHANVDAMGGLNAWLLACATKLAEGARLSAAVILLKPGQQAADAATPAEEPCPATPVVDDAPPATPAAGEQVSPDLNDNERIDDSLGVSEPDDARLALEDAEAEAA